MGCKNNMKNMLFMDYKDYISEWIVVWVTSYNRGKEYNSFYIV